jgi:hypothetical protein
MTTLGGRARLSRVAPARLRDVDRAGTLHGRAPPMLRRCVLALHDGAVDRPLAVAGRTRAHAGAALADVGELIGYGRASFRSMSRPRGTIASARRCQGSRAR